MPFSHGGIDLKKGTGALKVSLKKRSTVTAICELYRLLLSSYNTLIQHNLLKDATFQNGKILAS